MSGAHFVRKRTPTCADALRNLCVTATPAPILILFLIGYLRVRENPQELQHAFHASPSERGRDPFPATDLARRGPPSSTLEWEFQVVPIGQRHRSLAISTPGRATAHDRIGPGIGCLQVQKTSLHPSSGAAKAATLGSNLISLTGFDVNRSLRIPIDSCLVSGKRTVITSQKSSRTPTRRRPSLLPRPETA